MTWPNYSKACRSAVDDLLRRGGSLSAYRANPLFPSWTGPVKGSWAERLERDIERRFRVRHAVAVNSGTAALQAALASLSLKPGEEVVTSPYTFSATASAIVLSGGTPVFADVDPYTFCITKETVRHVFSKRTRAILPVSLFGSMADVRGLQSFGVPVIEDACQAVGARDSAGYSGTQGYAGCYSFNGGKNIPAGEAGCLVTNSDKVAEAARLLMNHGENFHQKQVGYNYRMNELTACVAWHGLQDLEERNQRRHELAQELVSDVWVRGCYGQFSFPLHEFADQNRVGEHAFYVFPFSLARWIDREKFCKRMEKRGIPVGRGYIQPVLSKYPAFRKYARGPLPVVEELSSKTLCILSTLTPDRPLSYARKVAEAMRESLA
jgi:perosamine synthetase